ncbi:hypothetical protein N7495_008722 [Penicillium taxi]|uniref:uncharacterized protein n=1 Tax=Penicillium taxi TaxID=168475 RepID=UPI0025450949|nr:uncharacterized protein N7495_008722 [Penicillium taxi]KAJ5888681.1 hypothetical protein N7495_008722 [Penicillium taxi]
MAANDLRGWVMSAVSGIACVFGASLICVDVILRQTAMFKGFQITNSNSFLSASLCLSAGVMLFTSLYSMLPKSQEYLTRGGFSPSVSAYILIGFFLGGVIVIRVTSGFLHRFIPSHVVDCDHSHDGPETDPERAEGQIGDNTHGSLNGWHEQSPLLRPGRLQPSRSETILEHVKRPSLRSKVSRRISSLVGGVKHMCDEDGPCYGFSQTCGHECTKVLPITSSPPTKSTHDTTAHDAPTPNGNSALHYDSTSTQTRMPGRNASDVSINGIPVSHQDDHHHRHHHHEYDEHHGPALSKPPGDSNHHHHVPQNAFLSIGLQTSLAIALHKLPEGFITYATNHASPTLGLTVFVALFIHNIVEGYAMALPLYLALHSRWKAMFWSSLLGGISQPAGAGLAALWLWTSERHRGHNDEGSSWGVYGGMFAVTAGVMTSVALSLFSEGLGLTHHRNLGIGFAVAGMGLMGVSFALTA